MSCYRTNVALSIKGDRIEKGTEIELSDEDASRFDPADITPVSDIPAPAPEAEETDLPLEELSVPQLKARAKELGLSTSGSKADLQERIALHLEGDPAPEGDEPEEGEDGEDVPEGDEPEEGEDGEDVPEGDEPEEGEITSEE